jgi:hypothetical protein
MVRWINRAAAVSLAALSVACGSPDTVDANDPRTAPIVARVECDAELAEPCARAVAAWNGALVGSRWRFVLGGEATRSVRVVAVQGNPSDCYGLEAWNGCSRGWDAGIEINVLISVGWRDVQGGRASIVAHELGHLLGVAHQESGLMSTKRLYNLQCIDAVTASMIDGAIPTCP